MRLVVGISGASGAIYGVRIVEVLQQLGVEVHLVVSETAARTISWETASSLADVQRMASKVYDNRDLGAAISSGSFPVEGMIVAPCSVKTMAGIANSFNSELLTRAADVQLKERRKLVLMLRETPLHLGHIQHMLSVTQMGGIILPPVPSFYHRPQTIQDIVDQSVQKALDQFGLEANLFQRWQGMDKS